MTKRDAARKTIATSTFDAQTQQLVLDAGQGKIRLTIEEQGEPVAVVMPIEAAQEWGAGRRRFFDKIREMQQTAGLSPEEADELAEEAVRAVRSAEP